MGMVLTNDLKTGMILGADVHDRNGRLLLGAESELTDKHIHIFQTWGVIEVDIFGVEGASEQPPLDEAADPELWGAVEGRVKPLFRHADLSHPVINRLLTLSILRSLRNESR